MYERKLLNQILDEGNLNLAIKQVKRNKGSAGVDGMTADQIQGYLALNKDDLLKSIRNRTYKPEAVLRVEIPKPNGVCDYLAYQQLRIE